MEQIINNLKDEEIIYNKSIVVLKKYIENKYPEASESFRAQVFADAVHKIIDDHIREFKHADQHKIKMELLTSTASEDKFEIVAYDIMKTCVALDINEVTFMDDMSDWINRHQDIPVHRDQLQEITELVKEEIRMEAAMASGTETIIADKDLLEQLEAAFDYEPSFSKLSEDLMPELFTEGEVNEAYEAEIRKDLETELSLTSLSEESIHYLDEISMETDIDYRPETVLEFDDNSLKGAESFMGMEMHEEEELTAPEDLLVSEPLRTVTTETEPYFSETPELWSREQGKKNLLDEVSEAIEGRNLKKIGIIVLIAIIGFAALIWFIYLLINGRIDTMDKLSLVEAETIVSAVSGAQSREATESRVFKAEEGTVRSKSSEHLHERMKYKEIDRDELRNWLVDNGSLVGEAPYFDTIVEVAEAYGVNPLLMFAIKGQELGFVPTDQATRIPSSGLIVHMLKVKSGL